MTHMLPATATALWLDDAVDGLVLGAVFAILAMGVVAIHRTTGVLNLAQGGMATLGALLWITLRAHGVGVPLAVAVVLVCGLLGGGVIGGLVGWPLRHASAATRLVGAVGLLLAVQGLTSVGFGNTSRPAPPLISGDSVVIGPVRIGIDGLLVLGVAVTAAVLLHLLYARTRIGLQMRAVATDSDAAALQGVDVRRVTVVSWAIGVGLAVAGGILLGPALEVVAPLLLTVVALQALAAGLVGELRSLPGALLGGLVLGEVVTAGQAAFGGVVGIGDIAVLAVVLGVVAGRGRLPLGVERV